MSSDAQAHPGDEDFVAEAGSSTDQHVTGAEETGTFITDQAPTGNTPAHGSSNEVFNKAGGNRVDAGDEATGGRG
jgi:hypothetical protein